MSSKRDKDHRSPQEEQAKVNQLRDALGPLDERASIFCSDDCLHRYLRARNWNLKKAEKMLKETLKWRKEFRPEEIRWDQVSKEAETGKLYRTNFLDKMGRSVLVMAPGKQNTDNHDNQIKHLVYCLENAIITLHNNSEQMVWLIDYRGWTLKKSPPLRTSRETIHILQNHYPERLGAAILYDPPNFFEAFWTVVKPFLDPKTYQKIKFVYSKKEDTLITLKEAFDMDKLEKVFGGNSVWTYNHEDYGNMMRQDDLEIAKKYKINVGDFNH